MKVLVTGGAGFIGANLVRMLIEKSYRVLVLDDLSTGKLKNLERIKLGFIEGSILNPAIVSQAVDWADCVVHLAAQVGVVSSLDNPHIDCAINVTGTLNVLDICRKSNIRRFVFASSNAAMDPLAPYGASKRGAEGHCVAYRNSYGLETVVLRLANVYGPFSMHKNSVVAKFFKDFMRKREIVIEGSGWQTRDFVYVNDVCRAIIIALESDPGGIFQIGTGVQTSILELASMIASHMPHNIEVKHSPPRPADKQSRSDIIETGKVLANWRPTVKLSDGLIDTWEWFNDNSDHAHP